MKAITPDDVVKFLEQVQADRKTAYWGDGERSSDLDGVEAWLGSLLDHVSHPENWR